MRQGAERFRDMRAAGGRTPVACALIRRMRRCVHRLRDRDGDGHWPAQCGGLDCDDESTRVPTFDDGDCDGRDGDCDGKIDEEVDTQSDVANCGACGIGCLSGVCENGACSRCGSAGEACCSFDCNVGVRNPSEVAARSARGNVSANACTELAEGDERCGGVKEPGTCSAGECRDCGREGQACCTGREPGVIDVQGVHAGCLVESDRERPLGAGHLQCSDGTCQRCGETGQPCCDLSGLLVPSCQGSDVACVEGTCQPCGWRHQPCCGGGFCHVPLTSRSGAGVFDESAACVAGTCEFCGKLGDPCCDGMCDKPLMCAAGACVPQE